MNIHKFQQINKKYDSLFKENLQQGKLPMRTTEFGFWGTASCYTLFEFFEKINLHKYKNFLDLGSGDGRAVLIASLFTKATGIEGDEELTNQSEQLAKEMELDVNFHCDDFMKHDFSKYDFIFIYPDKGFSKEILEKLKKEFKGDFYVYNQIYVPHGLKKGKTTWIDQMPITHYEVQ